MLDRLDKTIAAIASAPGPALRGIVRVSGEEVRRAIEQFVRLDDLPRFSAATRAMRHTGAVVVAEGASLDVAVLLWPTGRSYTGEPMAEIHTIGSPPLLDEILNRLYQAGVVPAATGEFTLRAFLNRRIDLLQAEAVLGVIDAGDQQSLHLALSQLAGGLSSKLTELREQLLIDLADLEAGLDFVEEDIEFVQREAMIDRLTAAAEFIRRLQSQAEGRLQTNIRRRVLLAGLPNAGKSSLFNALIGHEQAIVSPIPGTTRDYLTAHVEWDGVPIELIDTAGWEADAVGPLAEGLTFRDDQWRRSDLIVWCSACDQSQVEMELDKQSFSDATSSTSRVLRLRTKCDLAEPQALRGLRVSIHDSASIDAAKAALAYYMSHVAAGTNELLASTGSRCRDCLASAAAALAQALALAQEGADDTLISLELRAALSELGVITGQTYTDDILDRIFSRFCIGK